VEAFKGELEKKKTTVGRASNAGLGIIRLQGEEGGETKNEKAEKQSFGKKKGVYVIIRKRGKGKISPGGKKKKRQNISKCRSR